MECPTWRPWTTSPSPAILRDRFCTDLLDPTRIPCHEAGHAIVARDHRFSITRVTIVPNFLPNTADDLFQGKAEFAPPWPSDYEPSWPISCSRARTAATVMLAGRAAEREILSKPISDVADGSAGDRQDFAHLLDYWYPTMQPAARVAYLDKAQVCARRIVRANRDVLDVLVEPLRSHLTLDQEQLDEILMPVRQRRPRASDRRWARMNDEEFSEVYLAQQ